MKKLFAVILFIVFFSLSSSVFAGQAPEIKNFHAWFNDGMFGGVAKIIDHSGQGIQGFSFGSVYGVKKNGQRIDLGSGACYPGPELKEVQPGVYWFQCRLTDNRLNQDIVYIICQGTAIDASGAKSTKRTRGYSSSVFSNKTFKTQINNYPNPFNPTTTIRYSVISTGKVNLTIYNLLGQRVAVLVNSRQSAGQYAVKFDGRNLSSGIYILKLQVDNQSPLVHRINLLK